MSIAAKVISAMILVSTAMSPTNMTTAPTNQPKVSTNVNVAVAPAKPQAVKQEFGQVINVYKDSYLNFRTGPSLESKIQGKFYLGMTFKIISKEGDWYKISFNNKTGYVYKDYIVVYTDKAPNELYQTPIEQPKAKVEVKKLQKVAKKHVAKQSAKKTESKREVSNTHHWKKVKVELTAYDNSYESSGNWGSQTAMGTRTRTGVIAAPANIKLGTKVKIPALEWYKSDGIFSVEDRGGAVVQKANGNYVIDVWFPNGTDLNKFGRQYTYMYIME